MPKGIYNGRGLAAALMWGATAVWVGTRFVNAEEAGAPVAHQKAVINADFEGQCSVPSIGHSRLARHSQRVGLLLRHRANSYLHGPTSPGRQDSVHRRLASLASRARCSSPDYLVNRENNRQKEIQELMNKVR
jgi:Nitronate monooxygenase